MKRVNHLVCASVIAILMTGCGAAEFTGSSANSKATGNEANGTLAQGAGDSVNGNLGQEVGDDAAGNIPQLTIDEFLGALGQTPGVPADGQLVSQIEDQNDCYISHSGGHGIDFCVQDPTPLLPLSVRGLDPRVEVKGSEVCAKKESVIAHPDLFKAAGAVTGRCR